MTMEEPAPTAGRRFIATLTRILLVALIGLAIGVGAYFGLPLAYRGLVEPVQLNADRIDDLEQQLARTRADLTGLSEHGAERSADLEAASVETRESLGELRVGIEGDLADLAAELDDLADQVGSLGQTVSSQAEALQTLEARAEPDVEIQRQLTITRALLHLLRARLWLIENDQVLAAAEVQVARDALEGIAGVESAVARLNQALDELVATPLVASEDLEIAWTLLLSAEPNATPGPRE